MENGRAASVGRVSKRVWRAGTTSGERERREASENGEGRAGTARGERERRGANGK